MCRVTFAEAFFFLMISKGYGFSQDAKKMSMSFPMFEHKFSVFEEDVVNVDEVVTEVNKADRIL